MAVLQNAFSWSKTRDGIFRRCPRQYYFQYYGSWGGWEPDCDPRTREIYLLKQLTSRPVWAGSKVHDCIKRSLENRRRGIEPMAEAEAIDTTLAVMRADFANSRKGYYRNNPKSCGFFEHEYGIELPRSAWKETADHVVHCLRTFYRSEIFGRIAALPRERWLELEEFSSFLLDDTRIHVVLDFSCRDERGGVVVYDWKTGRFEEEKNDIQLACYCLYATERWQLPPERVSTVEFHLNSGAIASFAMNDKELASIRQYIRGSIRDMKLLLDDPGENRASEDRFAFAEKERVCSRCSFRRICPKWEGKTAGR